VGPYASGQDQGKVKKSSVQAEDVSKKNDQNSVHSLEKDKVSSCGSAGTKLSPPGSSGLAKEADSRDRASLLENQNRPTVKIPSKSDHNYRSNTEVCIFFVLIF
jgi:sister-chromatid-cohesion protein PDS5